MAESPYARDRELPAKQPNHVSSLLTQHGKPSLNTYPEQQDHRCYLVSDCRGTRPVSANPSMSTIPPLNPTAGRKRFDSADSHSSKLCSPSPDSKPSKLTRSRTPRLGWRGSAAPSSPRSTAATLASHSAGGWPFVGLAETSTRSPQYRRPALNMGSCPTFARRRCCTDRHSSSSSA
eukprot:3252213-Prymnesium_polylepis.1